VRMALQLGKQPIVCLDTPGFIVNRVARNYYGEALRIAGEGSASPALVDGLLERCGGFRMGPFTLMDLIGIDVNFDVTQSVYGAFHGEPRYRPHPLQQRLVEAGRLGQKTGRGFYRYNDRGEQIREALPDRKPEPQTRLTPVQMAVIGDTPLAASLRLQLARTTGRPAGECGLVYNAPLYGWDAVGTEWRAAAAVRRARVEERRPYSCVDGGAVCS